MHEVGSWRKAILVKCKICKKPMSHYKVTDDAVCVTCELKRRKSHGV